MADIKERIQAELENIDKVLKDLPGAHELSNLSTLELAGVAALLQSFYNGIESVVKQVVTARGLPIPSGNSWHRDLIETAYEASVISQRTRKHLAEYLAFRHFFSHAYAFALQPSRMEPLVENAPAIFSSLKTDMESVLNR